MGNPINISYPGGGPDVTRRNREQILYIKGDANTDGSLRLIFIEGQEEVVIQLRDDGVFNDTSFRVAASSIAIGRDLKIGGAASFIETFNPSVADEHQRALVPHITFGDEGTEFVHTPVTKPIAESVIFAPAVSEIISTTIGINFTTTHARIIKTIEHQIGTVGASDPVVYSIFAGTDNNGILIVERNLGIGQLIAESPLLIQFNFDMGLRNSQDYFIELTSPNAFSLKTDSMGNPLLTFIEEELGTLDIVTENLVWDNDLNHVLNSSLDPVYLNQFPHSDLITAQD